jgi:hypothetical protein
MASGWRTPGHGDSKGGGVERRTPDGRVVRVRDSVNRGAGHLAFPFGEWRALLAELDRM